MTMFGQMEPFYLLWNGGILQLQDAIAVQIAAVLGVLRKSPTPSACAGRKRGFEDARVSSALLGVS